MWAPHKPDVIPSNLPLSAFAMINQPLIEENVFYSYRYSVSASTQTKVLSLRKSGIGAFLTFTSVILHWFGIRTHRHQDDKPRPTCWEPLIYSCTLANQLEYSIYWSVGAAVSNIALHLLCAARFSVENIQYPVLHLVVFQMLNVFSVFESQILFAAVMLITTSAVHAKAILRSFGLLELTLDRVVNEYRQYRSLFGI